MKRKFCDVCGEPALDNINNELFAELPVPSLSVPGGKVCLATARVHFGFQNHQTGFGGPPDLCKGCVDKLIAQFNDVLFDAAWLQDEAARKDDVQRKPSIGEIMNIIGEIVSGIQPDEALARFNAAVSQEATKPAEPVLASREH